MEWTGYISVFLSVGGGLDQPKMIDQKGGYAYVRCK